MEFFEAVRRRRSIRRFSQTPVPDAVIEKALEAAILAPNSSNTQTWNFYWVKSPDKKEKLVSACLSQSAARTASHLVVITADPRLWRRSQQPLIKWVKGVSAPKPVIDYYEKLIPLMYRWGIFNSLAPIKFVAAFLVGIFRPMVRGPFTRRGMQEVAIKSAALAAENFVLAVSAQGFASCMMEGFDESRVSRLLRLGRTERVVMVIGVGEEQPPGTWGARFRLPSSDVIKIV